MNFADRVLESASSTGTGDFTLPGVANTTAGYRTFQAALGSSAPSIPYTIVGTTGQWEVGVGTLTANTNLARTRVYASSNANAAVDFAVGVKDVFITIPGTWEQDLLPRGRIEQMRLGAAML